MSRLFMSLLLFMCSMSAFSQVSYGSITWGNYNMKINVSVDNDSTYLYVIYSDRSKRLTDTPKMLLRLMDDSVLTLVGKNISTINQSEGGIVVSGIFLSEDYYISEAKFSIAKEQLEQLKIGVKKLRLNTSPKYHEKEWSYDKIGKKLYEAYVKSAGNTFEEGF